MLLKWLSGATQWPKLEIFDSQLNRACKIIKDGKSKRHLSVLLQRQSVLSWMKVLAEEITKMISSRQHCPKCFWQSTSFKNIKNISVAAHFFHSHLDHCRSPCSLQIKVSSLHAFQSTPFHSSLDAHVRIRRTRNHSPPRILLRWPDCATKCVHIR